MRQVPHLAVAADNSGTFVGFIGTSGSRIEMLFVAPEMRSKGIGKALLQYVSASGHITEVTVNEQNPRAVGFYAHMGFKTYKRTPLDEQGHPYPLLHASVLTKNAARQNIAAASNNPASWHLPPIRNQEYGLSLVGSAAGKSNFRSCQKSIYHNSYRHRAFPPFIPACFCSQPCATLSTEQLLHPDKVQMRIFCG